MKAKCIVCKRSLVAIGSARENGVSHHNDWASRQYHKKCLKDLIWKKDYFSVPYERREHARSLGAKWNPNLKYWYAPNDYVYQNLRAHYAWVDIDQIHKMATRIQQGFKFYVNKLKEISQCTIKELH